MKICIELAAVSLLWFYLVGTEATAQTNVVTPATRQWSGRVVLPPDQPVTTDAVNPAPILQRPALTERNKLPPEVQARIGDFRRYAQRYMEQEERLKKQLLGATDQERAIIREQLRAARQELLERAREVREEFKERQQMLMEKLPGHRELLEDAREAAREQLMNQTRGNRTRPGQN